MAKQKIVLFNDKEAIPFSQIEVGDTFVICEMTFTDDKGKEKKASKSVLCKMELATDFGEFNAVFCNQRRYLTLSPDEPVIRVNVDLT